MYHSMKEYLQRQLEEIRKAGLYKAERILTSGQHARIQVGRKEVLNFCANNYLGLANHPAVVKAAHEALDRWGYGLSSVRFICGTQEIHKELEQALSDFLGTVTKKLTVGMYEFTAPHIVQAVLQIVNKPSVSLSLTLHPVPEPPAKSGVKAQDVPEADTVGHLMTLARPAKTKVSRFKFAWAPVGKGEQFASAYHIKVAVADSTHFWLSSGNWQSSNQPGPAVLADKPAGFQQNYNRDYHVVIQNPRLAST